MMNLLTIFLCMLNIETKIIKKRKEARLMIIIQTEKEKF